MASQTTNGKAFEYAVLTSVKNCCLSGDGLVVDDIHFQSAQRCFESLAPEERQNYLQAAAPASAIIATLEPCLLGGLSPLSPLKLCLQSDQAGGDGDVRDLIISRDGLPWEIGISAKNKHEAVKHSRLSMSIDFGQKWLGLPCSPGYFEAIRPIFSVLSQYKENQTKWSELPCKEAEIYVPLLKAFRKELLDLDKQTQGLVAQRLVTYLIGNKDFYKVIKHETLTSVQAFNLHGGLNLPWGKQKSPVKLGRLKLPNRIVELDFRRESDSLNSQSDTTLHLICDEGWQMSFRIHNAETMVIPSLKFDITLIGRPNSLRSFDLLWN
jgi:hypothetical protein